MLAAEKARRLAREGFSTLLVCFNAPLARMLAEATADVAAETEQLTVATFHQLCQDLGREAEALGERPDPVPQAWWDETLPNALVEAGERLGPRYHAIVVDEGQDFAPDWLLALEALSFGGRDDVLYVFHDPAQAIYREDVVEQLGLQEYPLDMNCRNAQPIHAVVARFAGGGLASMAMRDDGRAPELIEADGPAATLEALRKALHRLRVEEDVPPWHIAVLTGSRLEESAVWRQRRFGNEALDNPAVDGEGQHLGRAANETPELPSDAILCDTIRRFKGLERSVVVLVELDGIDPAKLDRLLYVGASRARQHLVVIASATVLGRLR
jgi:superfamily I DNA/RNA helicase